MMTPQWLKHFATLSQVSAATPESLLFKMTQRDARIIRVNLFPSGEFPSGDIAVTITLHLEDPPTSDSDFLIGICDDTVCNGLWITDSGNYPNAACQYATMNSGTTYTNNHNSPTCGAPITYEHYPNTVTLTFYPVNKWGSFSIPPSGGYTTAGTFIKGLELSKGLYLEAYGNNVNEQYKLMFMEVKVIQNWFAY